MFSIFYLNVISKCLLILGGRDFYIAVIHIKKDQWEFFFEAISVGFFLHVNTYFLHINVTNKTWGQRFTHVFLQPGCVTAAPSVSSLSDQETTSGFLHFLQTSALKWCAQNVTKTVSFFLCFFFFWPLRALSPSPSWRFLARQYNLWLILVVFNKMNPFFYYYFSLCGY